MIGQSSSRNDGRSLDYSFKRLRSSLKISNTVDYISRNEHLRVKMLVEAE